MRLGFFDRKASGTHSNPEPDQFILDAGAMTEDTMRYLRATSISSSLAIELWLVQNHEREFPGYRAELNRRRAAAGLPPI
jgi:hypothetical protein